ncbi:hypothetical protein ACFQGT_18935 [Natrialbaceae archaeon GCM10025810]|uniref:DUF7344 domain-containing protein n=1 Tax=Halovalidus salilacus TaxID=3075124 RepID=UPI00360BAAE6
MMISSTLTAEAWTEQVADEETIATICNLLGNRRCQAVLAYFFWTDHDEAVPVRAVAKAIAAYEESCPVDAVEHRPYKRVRETLLQTHLQKLADAGLIQYDGDRKWVAPGRDFNIAVQVLLHLFVVLRPLTLDTDRIDSSCFDGGNA